MQKGILHLLFIVFFLSIYNQSFAQGNSEKKETLVLKNILDSGKQKKEIDTSKKVKSIASRAALKSAILPGLGQIYNRKYWKLPLVYGAIALPVSLFSYNRIWYKKTRLAYTIRSTNDSANFSKMDVRLIPLSTASLKLYRNEFRKNMDFSVISLLLIWGLNVVDATVDGHLRTFDISDDLSMQIKPQISNNLGSAGLSFRIGLKQKDNQVKTISF